MPRHLPFIRKGNDNTNPACKACRVYSFKGYSKVHSKWITYMFYAEEYEGLEGLFMIKFCLREHRKYKAEKRFTYLVGDPILARAVLETCVHIIADISKDIPDASFGFIGQEDGRDKERLERDGTRTSRRFRVESFVSRNLIRSENYVQQEVKKKNAYFIIHKSNDPTEFKAKVVDAFNQFHE